MACSRQMTGWQTVNGVFETGEASSALFNATTNSNGIFVELYEEKLWKIMRSKGTGPSAAPLSVDPLDEDFAYNKNLHEWSNELHFRRSLLDPGTDPFPTSYAHTFDKNLWPEQTVPYRFVSPHKCKNGGLDGLPTPQLKRVGLIRVTGI